MVKLNIPEYRPDSVLLNNETTDTLNNIFISNNKDLICVSDKKYAAPQPYTSDNRISYCETIFSSPTVIGNFNTFCGTSDGLFVWSNIEHRWIQVYQSRNTTPNRDDRWIISDFNTWILASKPGEGLLYWNKEENIFKEINKTYGSHYCTSEYVIVWNIDNEPNKLAWSGIKDCFNWDTSKGSGFTIITQGSVITNVLGGADNPFIFTLRMTYRMSRIPVSVTNNVMSSPWSFKLISKSLGSYQHNCAENILGEVYLSDTQSYFKIDLDNIITDIGKDRVAITWPWKKELRVLSDVLSRRIYYVYPNIGTLVYNENVNLWSTMDHEGLDVFIGNFSSRSLDEIDDVDSICLIPYSLDSIQDVYSCSLALSINNGTDKDGIYLLNNNKKLISNIKHSLISDDNTNIFINNIRAITDSSNPTYNIDYGYNYNLDKNRFIETNKYGYANCRLRAGQFTITANVSFNKYYQGIELNTKQGLYK